MNVGANLRRERTARRLTQAELAGLAQLGHNTIGQIERGDTSPTIDTLEAIARAMTLQLSDLIGEKLAPVDAELAVPIPYFEDVPYEGWADGPDKDLERTYYVPADLAGPERIAAQIHSETMYPTLWPGDVVLLDMLIEKPKSGSIAVVEINKEFSARRLRRMRTQLMFVADNPHYPPIVVKPDDEFWIVGEMIAILHRDLTLKRY